MRNIKYFFLFIFGLLIIASCSDDDDNAAGKPQMTVNGLAEAACYGDSIFFTVDCSDAEGIPLSTLKVYLEYSGEQVSSQVTRTKDAGTYRVALYAPMYKKVPDGSADIRLVLQNIRLAKTENVVKLPLTRPKYESIKFVSSTGTIVTLMPDASDPYLFKGTFTSANRTFKGHFIAPKKGTHGTEITFGQGNDGVKEGVTDDITFNGNKGDNTVSFNVYTYEYAPTEADANASTELVFTKADNLYVGELIQGHKYEFAGEAIINSSRWFYDSDWFSKNGDGTYTFRAVTGTYSLTADFTDLAFRVWTMDGANSASLQADGTGAIWIIGNNGVGKPLYTAGNVQSWWTGEDHNYCLTPIAPKIHQITLTVGKQLRASDVNFKFFGQANWGIEFKGTESDYHLSTSSEVFIVGEGADGHDDGNIYVKDGVELNDGDTYVFKIDLTNGTANGVLTITKL
jgi:hypothetical protein